MARRVLPGDAFIPGLVEVTLSGEPCENCLDWFGCQTKEAAQRLAEMRQCPKGLPLDDMTISIDRELIRYSHWGYVEHDFLLTEWFGWSEVERYGIIACDIPEPVNHCLFKVSAFWEYLGEYTDTRDLEITYCRTRPEAEAAFATLVEEYRAKAKAKQHA